MIVYVCRLSRDDSEMGRTAASRTYFDGRVALVAADLSQPDYARAIHAKKINAQVVMKGELERFNGRWHLRNAHIAKAIYKDGEDGGM